MSQQERDGSGPWLIFALSWMVTATLLLLALRLPLGESSHGISVLDAAHFLLFGAALLLAFPLGRALGPVLRGSAPDRVKRTVTSLLIAALWLWFMLAAGPGFPLIATCAGLVLLAAGLTALVPRCRGRHGLAAMALAGIAAAFFHQLILVKRGYAQPWAFERALAGIQHPDTLFHSAIAGMFLSDGAPSIGIDGDTPIHYHTASHFLIGHLAGWVGVPPLQAYSLFVPIVGVPLLFAMLLCATEAIITAWTSTDTQPTWSRQLVVLVIAFVAIRMDRGTLLISESYFVSITCMLAGIYVLAATRGALRHWYFLSGLLIAVLVLLASMSKISTGAVMACGVAVWLALRPGRPTIGSVLAGAIFGLVPFFAVYAMTWVGVTGKVGGISPFAVLFKNTERTVFDLAFGGVIAAIAWWRHRADSAMYPLLGGLATMILAASGSALLLKLPSGSDFYFLNVGVIAAFCLLPLLAPFHVQFGRHLPARQASILLVAILVVLFAGHDTRKIPQKFFASAGRLSDGTKGGITESLLHRSPYGRIFTRIEATPGIDGVYVDPGYDAFWRGYHRVCWAAPLTIPALTGVPMLMGYPPPQQGCDVTRFYGFHYYSPAHSAPVANATRGYLCKAAADRGMSRILRVGATGAQEVVDCRHAATKG